MKTTWQTTTILVLGTTLLACGDDLALNDPDDPAAKGAVLQDDDGECQPTQLRADLPWYGDNAATLTGWLDSRGCTSPGYHGNRKPVALFDWDNTITKNDFGDAFTFYLIAHDKVRQPPGFDWRTIS